MLKHLSASLQHNDSSAGDQTLLSNCSIAQTFTESDYFFECYRVLYAQKWVASTAEILLALFIVLLNALVISMLSHKPEKLTLFDKIMIAHCIVDGLTGLLDVPFFHFNDVFGYWPFGTLASLFWSSYDNGLNLITNSHMLYMTWVRYRSIRVPNTFEKEICSQYPIIVCISIWILGLTVWSIITFSFGVYDFSTSVNYRPAFVEIIFIFFTWFCPLLAIFILAVFILSILSKRRKRAKLMKKISPSTTRAFDSSAQNSDLISIKSKFGYFRKFMSRSHLGPQARFQIIVMSYWLQWFPSCMIALVDPICNDCIPYNVSSGIYWLTYTVCLTDPLVIIVFNPNVGFNSKRKKPK